MRPRGLTLVALLGILFTPALAGLLPDKAVRPGARWTATRSAVQELTDMERIEDGQVECRFEQTTTLSQRRHARIAFSGTVRGISTPLWK